MSLVTKSVFTGSIKKRNDLERLKPTCSSSCQFSTLVNPTSLGEVRRQIKGRKGDGECTHLITKQYLAFLLVTEKF